MGRYDVFLDSVGKSEGPNRFWTVNQRQVADAEARMSMEFPVGLRTFFTEVGSGFWAQGVLDETWDRSLTNRIPSPTQIADLLCDEDNSWRPREGFIDSAIPFFDVGENMYLLVRVPSPTPTAVFWPDGRQAVSGSIEAFFAELSQKAGFYCEQ